MNLRVPRGTALHRVAVLVAVVVAAVDAVLFATGALSGRQALFLLVAVELPCTLVVGTATWLLVRRLRRDGAGRREALEQVLGTGPVGAAEAELRALRAVALFAVGRREPAGGPHLPYGRGLAGTVVAFVVVAVVETVVLHLLIPVGWVLTLLTVLSVYALVMVLGLTLSRLVYPHFVADGGLQLRAGARDVVRIDLRDVTSVVSRHRITVVGLFPKIDGNRLVLPSQDGTNLDLALAVPVEIAARAAWPRRRAEPQWVQHVSLHVDDPAVAVALLTEHGAGRRPVAREP